MHCENPSIPFAFKNMLIIAKIVASSVCYVSKVSYEVMLFNPTLLIRLQGASCT